MKQGLGKFPDRFEYTLKKQYCHQEQFDKLKRSVGVVKCSWSVLGGLKKSNCCFASVE